MECFCWEYWTFPIFQSPALREDMLPQFFLNYPYSKLGIDSFLAWVKEYQVFSPHCQFYVYSKPTISHYHVTICKFVQTSTINCDFVIWDPSAPFFRSKTNHSCWSGANQIFSCIVFHVCARVFTFNRRAVKGSIQSMIDTHFWNFLKFFGRSLIFLFLTTLSNTANILQESITSSKIFYNLPLV